MSNIYSKIILEHSNNPRNYGALYKCDKNTTRRNRICGDELSVFAKFETEQETQVISAVSFMCNGCAITQASASIITEHIKNMPISEALDFVENFPEWIESNPECIHKDEFQALREIRTVPARLNCALLPFVAIQDLLKDSNGHA